MDDASRGTAAAFSHPILEGARIRLREHRAADYADFFALHSDPAVMRYWSFPAWTDRAQGRDYHQASIDGRDPEQMLCWAIAGKDDDRLIGACTLFAIHREQGRAELGYALQSPHWGRGLGGEALRLLIDYAFNGLGLRRLEADADPRNTNSCGILEHLGFAREGLLRERWCVAGELQDAALYGLLAREWLSRAP